MGASLEEPLVDVVVVAFESRKHLPRLITALQRQAETRWRLILVDNASSADNRPVIQDLPAGVDFIQHEVNMGFAAGCNIGASRSHAPFIAFLNPDAFPEPTWLSELLGVAARHPQAGAIGSTQMRADAPNVYDGAGDVLHAIGFGYRSAFDKQLPSPLPEGETFSACAAAALYRRDAFYLAGGFDERYFCYFEDVDLGFRLRLAGSHTIQSPNAIVAHVGGASASAGSAFADFHGARNRLWTFVKCMPAPIFWPLLPLHLSAALLHGFYNLARGRGSASLRGLAAALAGMAPFWRDRRDLAARRKARTADIASALAWSPFALLTRRPVIRKPRPQLRTQ